MKKQSRLMALAGMMVALGSAIMLLGGVIPLSTFFCPALAGLTLLPILIESGRKWTLSAYAAIAVLSLLLDADKEAALLFAFLGYYPVLKTIIDRLPKRSVRIVLKLLVFNVAVGLMTLIGVKLLGMDSLIEDYAAMTRVALIVYIIVCNFTLLVYDRMLDIMAGLYITRMRPKLKL